ncbi:hypothetical protein MASR2M66_29640 [Chloroflexota bacterium]
MASDKDIIDISPSGDVSFVTSVTNFLQALNPLGAISQTIGKIMAVRVQMKKLQNEAEEIKRDYEARSKMIDGAMKYAVQQLELQRIGMEKYFEHASKQLELSRIYSSERVKVIQAMTSLMVNPNASLEEKKLAQETIKAMSSDLILSQEAGSTTLSALIEASNKNLLSVPSLAGLLPSNRK